MAKQEREDRNKQQLLEEIEKLCHQLPPWELFRIYLYIKKVSFQEKFKEMVWSWLLFQWKLVEAIKVHRK